MAVITPQSDVMLVKVPLEIDNNNQLTFANATAQFNYFNSLPKISYDDFTYIRKDGVLRIPAVMDDILSYNYVMYRNDAYSSKWFYAYITGMEYVNDSVTDVSIATDTFQTWQFDLSYKRTFVEREHVNDDTAGTHTLPENLETGEYVKNYAIATPEIAPSDIMFCVGVSDVIGTLSPKPASTINGLPNGLFYIFTESTADLHSIADMYDWAGKADAIYTMFVFPKILLYTGSTYAYQSATWSYSDAGHSQVLNSLYVPTTSSGVGQIATNYTISKPDKIANTYTPKNKKLLCYPYCFLNVTNNSGTTVEYRYEDFNGNPKFNVDGVLSVGCATKLYPINYKKMELTGDNTYDYGLNGGKYPSVSWNSDSFTNWITQNSVNMNANVGIRALTAGMGAVGFGGIGGALATAGGTALFNIAQNVKETVQASRMPDQARGNLNVGDLNYSKHKNSFTFLPLSIKPEYAKVIDDFFSMFGYKVNEVKVPNITGRRNWNYVKTVGCYIEADIPQDDLQQIKLMFDKGITFWHNPATFCDYSQNNDII